MKKNYRLNRSNNTAAELTLNRWYWWISSSDIIHTDYIQEKYRVEIKDTDKTKDLTLLYD